MHSATSNALSTIGATGSDCAARITSGVARAMAAV
jgi:hypothetical protein